MFVRAPLRVRDLLRVRVPPRVRDLLRVRALLRARGVPRALCCPVLIDFGIARVWREGEEADTTHFGTRSYAPPEQYGFGQTDVRSDVYALGMLNVSSRLTGREATPADRECDFACA